MNVWEDSYRAVMQHLRSSDGYIVRGLSQQTRSRGAKKVTHLQYRRVHMRLGTPVGALLDSLSAFWPGLQVLAGDIEGAIQSHLVCE
jgi:mannosidase alpha-like ER degradation enhancer 1